VKTDTGERGVHAHSWAGACHTDWDFSTSELGQQFQGIRVRADASRKQRQEIRRVARPQVVRAWQIGSCLSEVVARRGECQPGHQSVIGLGAANAERGKHVVPRLSGQVLALGESAVEVEHDSSPSSFIRRRRWRRGHCARECLMPAEYVSARCARVAS
jgi:hypothetical protein